MTASQRTVVAARLADLADAQRGYFTRAQACREGVDDMALKRAVLSGAVERLDHGVYRITGAGQDPHQTLRVAWLRLTPDSSPRERTARPHLWVSHRSAASVFDLGVTVADTPEFISDHRLQTRANVTVHVRSKSLSRREWMVREGFAVTTPARTIADLATDHMDGGHLGRIASDALGSGLISPRALKTALGERDDADAILEQAIGKAR